ncbi:hypothetical protein INT47_012856 [Mucor saturninus]|uniref:Uncharacterized protein n=1 Tax=Mucor saturninus TaxID=64648 RepID=A0A8H7QWS8_9FUNG|nr:hypothetical protein INT47_012856 [Mucor saturninus]
MDRASEAAANDLAEVRKLIEGMNALVNSQMQQQQQHQLQHCEYPNAMQQQQDAAALMATIAAVAQQNNHNAQQSTLTSTTTTNNNNTMPPEQSPRPTSLTPATTNNTDTTANTPPPTASTAATEEVKTPIATAETDASPTQQAETQVYSNPAPQAGVIIEVTHLTYNRTLYFQLTQDATIEPMIAWLRLSFVDSAISGMVLQYKGFDGLWKCLLNRDDSLRRILKQSMKGNTMLQMRVPREQDLLSSGYTDRRLLALTKPDSH